MANDIESAGSERGKPGALARDIIRVQDEPIAVNYHRGGVWSAQCPDCGEWHEWHSEDGAVEEAERCCGNYTTDK